MDLLNTWAAAASSDQPASASELAYRTLREQLVDGRFAPGDRLTELHLSAELGISRTPIREALRRLQSDGLVKPSGRGVVIAPLSASQVRDAYELRAALEALAAELAAGRQAMGAIAPAELSALQHAVEVVEQAIAAHDVAGATRANLRLHALIAQLSANAPLNDALGRLWDRIAISSLSNLHDESWAQEITAHHRDIVDAIVRGAPDEAASHARHHIRRAAEVYTDHEATAG